MLTQLSTGPVLDFLSLSTPWTNRAFGIGVIHVAGVDPITLFWQMLL